MKNKDMKILIIDDLSDNLYEMTQGLCELGYNENNIFPQENESELFSNQIRNYASSNQVCKICKTIIEYIENDLDVLFLDLNLTGSEPAGETSGENIIEFLSRSDNIIFANLPIVIVSMHSDAETREGVSKHSALSHIKKDSDAFDKDDFIKSFHKKELMDSLKVKVANYRKIKETANIKIELEKLQSFIDFQSEIFDVLTETKDKVFETNTDMKKIVLYIEQVFQKLDEIGSEVTKDNIDKLLESIQGISGIPIKSLQDLLQLGNEPLLRLHTKWLLRKQ